MESGVPALLENWSCSSAPGCVTIVLLFSTPVRVVVVVSPLVHAASTLHTAASLSAVAWRATQALDVQGCPHLSDGLVHAQSHKMVDRMYNQGDGGQACAHRQNLQRGPATSVSGVKGRTARGRR